MKKSRKGEIKLEKGDVRIGNFVVHTEKEHYKIQDIMGVFTYRVAAFTNAGMMMSMAVDKVREGDEECKMFLGNYCATMYNILCCVPDADFFKDLNGAALACVNRHKEMYGVKDDLTAEEDAQIVSEEKELNEVMDDIKKEMNA